MLPQDLSDAERDRIIQIMTTEHFTLQTARAETTAETNGRSNVYLAAVSSAIVALAFIGQVSEIGSSFYIFALLLFPTLFFIGFVTFRRAVQSAALDFLFSRGIARIHHLYGELAPQVKPYIVLPTRDNDYGMNVLAGPTWLQFLLTAAGMIAVINSVILGVIVALVVSLLVGGALLLAAALGAVIAVISVALHVRTMYTAFAAADERTPAMFPLEGANDK